MYRVVRCFLTVDDGLLKTNMIELSSPLQACACRPFEMDGNLGGSGKVSFLLELRRGQRFIHWFMERNEQTWKRCQEKNRASQRLSPQFFTILQILQQKECLSTSWSSTQYHPLSPKMDQNISKWISLVSRHPDHLPLGASLRPAFGPFLVIQLFGSAVTHLGQSLPWWAWHMPRSSLAAAGLGPCNNWPTADGGRCLFGLGWSLVKGGSCGE